jgi:hypothetical protein
MCPIGFTPVSTRIHLPRPVYDPTFDRIREGIEFGLNLHRQRKQDQRQREADELAQALGMARAHELGIREGTAPPERERLEVGQSSLLQMPTLQSRGPTARVGSPPAGNKGTDLGFSGAETEPPVEPGDGSELGMWAPPPSLAIPGRVDRPHPTERQTLEPGRTVRTPGGVQLNERFYLDQGATPRARELGRQDELAEALGRVGVSDEEASLVAMIGPEAGARLGLQTIDRRRAEEGNRAAYERVRALDPTHIGAYDPGVDWSEEARRLETAGTLAEELGRAGYDPLDGHLVAFHDTDAQMHRLRRGRQDLSERRERRLTGSGSRSGTIREAEGDAATFIRAGQHTRDQVLQLLRAQHQLSPGEAARAYEDALAAVQISDRRTRLTDRRTDGASEDSGTIVGELGLTDDPGTDPVISAARSMVQGLSLTDAASKLLEAGFSPAEVELILGRQ